MMLSDWQKKTPEQKARYVANAKAKRHAKALAEGRMPGQIGTPIRVTEEQKAISLAKKRKRDSINSLKIRTAKRAAKAIAEGRIPGKPGKKAVSAEERKLLDKAKYERFRQKHKERRREYERKWKEELRATPEGREYLRMLARAHGAKRRAQKRNSPGTHTADDIRALFFEQNGKCALCDLPMEEKGFHVDHWKPLSKGGSNDKSNLKLLHPRCNLSKGAKLPTEINVRSA